MFEEHPQTCPKQMLDMLQEEMGCWEIVDVDSVPEGQNLIEAKWVFKVKYRGAAGGGMEYDKHRARIVAKGSNRGKALIINNRLAPQHRRLLSGSSLLSLQFLDLCPSILMQLVLLFQLFYHLLSKST
jgi:hypothetical protein